MKPKCGSWASRELGRGLGFDRVRGRSGTVDFARPTRGTGSELRRWSLVSVGALGMLPIINLHLFLNVFAVHLTPQCVTGGRLAWAGKVEAQSKNSICVGSDQLPQLSPEQHSIS